MMWEHDNKQKTILLNICLMVQFIGEMVQLKISEYTFYHNSWLYVINESVSSI